SRHTSATPTQDQASSPTPQHQRHDQTTPHRPSHQSTHAAGLAPWQPTHAPPETTRPTRNTEPWTGTAPDPTGHRHQPHGPSRTGQVADSAPTPTPAHPTQHPATPPAP